jgi:hypothetical protein
LRISVLYETDYRSHAVNQPGIAQANHETTVNGFDRKVRRLEIYAGERDEVEVLLLPRLDG